MNNEQINKLSFIVSALNAFWHNAHNNLERKDLGDIERMNYQKEKDTSKLLMDEIEDGTFFLISENASLLQRNEELLEVVRECYGYFSAPNFTDRYGTSERLKQALQNNQTVK